MTGDDHEPHRDGQDAEGRSGEPISIEAFHGLAAAYALDAPRPRRACRVRASARGLARAPRRGRRLRGVRRAPRRADRAGRPAAGAEGAADGRARLHPAGGSGGHAGRAGDAGRAGASVAPFATRRRRRPCAPVAPAPPVVPEAGASDRPDSPPALPATDARGTEHPAGPAETAARRRWFQRPGAIIAAAAAAVVLIAGTVIGIGWSGPNGWGAQREMAAIAEAPDAQSQTLEVEGGGEVTLVSSAAAGAVRDPRRGASRARFRPDLRALVHRRRGRGVGRHVRRVGQRDVARARRVVHAGRGRRDHRRAGRRFAATHDRTDRRHRHVVGCAQSERAPPRPVG